MWLGGASGWATRHAPVGADGAPRLIKVERPAMAGQNRRKAPPERGIYMNEDLEELGVVATMGELRGAGLKKMGNETAPDGSIIWRPSGLDGLPW